MAKITARNFYYNASRDIIRTEIVTLVAIVVFFIIRYALSHILCLLDSSLSVEDNSLFISLISLIYVIIAIYGLIRSIVSIHSHIHSQLRIEQDKIVYRYGKSSRTTIYIPSNKILSCSKHSTVLQRKFNTATIAITMGKDSYEICFKSIEYGEMAYELICQIIEVNKKPHTA